MTCSQELTHKAADNKLKKTKTTTKYNRWHHPFFPNMLTAISSLIPYLKLVFALLKEMFSELGRDKTSFQSCWKDMREGIWQLFQPSYCAGQGPGGGSRAWNVLLRKQYLSLTRDEEGSWHWNRHPIYVRMNWITMPLSPERRKEGRQKEGIKFSQAFLDRTVIYLCSVEACLYVSAPVGRDDHWPLAGVRCGLPQKPRTTESIFCKIRMKNIFELLQLSGYRSKNRLGELLLSVSLSLIFFL